MTAPNMSDRQLPAAAVPRRRRALALALLVMLGVAGYYSYRRTWPMVLTGPAAGVYQTFTYRRQIMYWTDMAGRRSVDTSFRVAYYSKASDIDSMQAEARRIAPALLPIADSAELRHLELQPSRPLLTPAFPVVTFSRPVHYRRQADGTWHEAVR